MPVVDAPRGDPRRPARLVLAALVLLCLALLAVLAARSTETWIPSDPAAVRHLLELREHERDLKREWETAQRGDTRFGYDTEIRFVAARIDELEVLAGRPRRIHGLAPWRTLLAEAGPALAIGVEVAAESLVSLALALAFLSVLGRLAEGPRRLALALALAPAALPAPFFAAAAVRLVAAAGFAPSPLTADVVEVLIALPFAVVILHFAAIGVDPPRLEAARDLGFSRAAIFARIVLPTLAPALALAFLLVEARLLGDLAVARLAGVDDAPHRLAEWLRHRIVGTVDFPTAAAGALVAALFGLALVVPLARRLASRRGAVPTPSPTVPRRVGLAALPIFLVVPALLLALLPPLSAIETATAVDAAPRLVALVAEWGVAGLAAVVALALALALALAGDRLGDRPLAVAVALAPMAIPAPAVAFALRLLAQAIGLPIGPWLQVPAIGLSAAGLPAVLLLLADAGRLDREARRDGAPTYAFRLRFAHLLPLAALLAFAAALAAGDVATVLGLRDRSALFGPVGEGADLTGPLAAALALGFGFLAAEALERARGSVARRRGLVF